MAHSRSIALTLLLTTALALASASNAGAVVIESITARATVTGSAMTTFTDSRAGAPQIRCTHNITIPTTAFSGTASVSIDAVNNTYTRCTTTDGGTCTVRVNGAWTLTAITTGSGQIRIESTVTVDCTNRVASPNYSCVFTVQGTVVSPQTLTARFTNPVSPATTGTLVVDTPNTVNYVVDSGTNCPLGAARTRGSATMSETISTVNVRIVP